MKKLILFILITTFMLSTTIQAFGKVTCEREDAQLIVNQANEKIASVIQKSQLKAEKVIAKYESGKISLEEKDEKISAIINQLLSKTTTISENAVAKAAKLNITVQCSLIEVIIDDQIILVDPLFIVGT